MATHVCPWWLAYTFDHPGRRLFHKPKKILAPYVTPGMTVMDVGCGMGYFAIPMARMVGETGKVIAIDLQRKMLDALMRRAARAGVAKRIQPHKCQTTDLGTSAQVDFAAAFYMVHETPDPDRLLQQVYACLKPGARLLVVEPRVEVGPVRFEQTILLARKVGFVVKERPEIRLSRAAVFEAV